MTQPASSPPMTTPAMLAASAAAFGARPALLDGDVQLSYAALAAAVRTATRALIATGVAPGDKVAIWAPNQWEWVVAALAAHEAGAALVPISTRFKGHEAGDLLARSGARTLFTVRGFLGTDYPDLLEAAGAPLPPTTIVMRGTPSDGTRDWHSFIAAGAKVPDSVAAARAAAVRPEALSDIIYTSGTTGRAKGVMCTHAQSVRVFRVWADTVGLGADDRYLVVAPFFHTFGYKAGFLAGLMTGCAVLPQAVFDAGAVLARIAADRVSVLPGPPTLYQSLLAHPERAGHDLGSLRLAVTGAAVVPVELVHRMRDELGFDTVLTAYGLTESTGVVTMCRPGDDAETIATTSGRAIAEVEVRVVDDAGAEVARGQPGEIWVRGYNVMAGYLDDPAETAAAIGDGWLRTGDIGVMDARGYLRITDRKKDMFIVGGFNAYPAEIEAALRAHPAIAEVAVVGAPDERLGEIGVAFVVARAGTLADPAEIIEWSRARMANYKVPRRVEVVNALPVNASGKVLKFELRKMACGSRS
ncbi:MAG: AMP-binding protein [Deltaproteobacteria bacterium]|nr:AMP-binding protein [Deltaproteobacteria bacterium]